MRPVPPGHVRVAHVIALDIPTPPPSYATLNFALLSAWLRDIIELGLEHANQEEIQLAATCDAACVLADRDLSQFVGPVRSLQSHVLRLGEQLGMTPAVDLSPVLRKAARKIAQHRREARVWRERCEQLRKDADWAKKRLENMAALSDIRSQEAEIELSYRPGRVFPVGSPEPDCDRLISEGGVVFRRSGETPSGVRFWTAQPPIGDGSPYTWRRLNNGDDPMIMTEMLPLV